MLTKNYIIYNIIIIIGIHCLSGGTTLSDNSYNYKYDLPTKTKAILCRPLSRMVSPVPNDVYNYYHGNKL